MCCNYNVSSKPRNKLYKEKYRDAPKRKPGRPNRKVENRSNTKKPKEPQVKSGKAVIELTEFITKEIRPEANYQFVMLKCLISKPSTINEISKQLAHFNNKNPEDSEQVKKFYDVPVFKVLVDSGFVKSTDQVVSTANNHYHMENGYELAVNFESNLEKVRMDEILQEKITEWNNENGISEFNYEDDLPKTQTWATVKDKLYTNTSEDKISELEKEIERLKSKLGEDE